VAPGERIFLQSFVLTMSGIGLDFGAKSFGCVRSDHGHFESFSNNQPIRTGWANLI
jgi:hypothetical protein